MTDVIINHSYIKTPCLQVFLYTSVDNLYKAAINILNESTHQKPQFVIVPSSDVKEALLSQMYAEKGHTSFSHMGTLPETLIYILKNYIGLRNPQIHDTISLTLAMYELILKKDECVSSLDLTESVLSDLDSVFVIAKELASQLIDILDVEPDCSNAKIISIKASIKKQMPEILFLDDAFSLCHEYYHSFALVGFYFLPHLFLEKLKQELAKIFLLVPSYAFLGDILSPRQRLKNLRDKNQKIQLLTFKEHPFLERLSRQQKDFYSSLSDLESLYFDEEDVSGQTTLEKIQNSLKTGHFESKYVCDDSLLLIDADGIYAQSLQLIYQLQELSKQTPSLLQKDVAIVTDIKKYGPILNALGQSMREPIAFACGSCDEDVFDVIKFLYNEQTQNQNYLIQLCQMIASISKNSEAPLYDKICTLLELLNQCHLSGINSQITGSDLIYELKKKLLKNTFFDSDENEIAFEANFLTHIGNDQLSEQLLLLDSVGQLINETQKLKYKLCSIQEWCIELFKILNSGLLSELKSFSHQKELIEKSIGFGFYTSEISIRSYFRICTFTKSSQNTSKYCIKTYGLNITPDKCYRFIFYLGVLPEANQNHQFFDYKFNDLDANILMLNQALNSLTVIASFENDFSSKSPSALFIETLKKELLEDDFLVKIPQLTACELADKTPFIPKEYFSGPEENYLSSNHRIDIQKFKKFIHDVETFVKKEYLQIAKDEAILDQDVSSRQLFYWLLQKYYADHSVDIVDSFARLTPQEKKNLYLRSFFTKNDSLTNLRIAEPLQISIQEDQSIDFYGLDDEKLESKINSRNDKVIYFLKIKHFFISTNQSY